MRCTAGQSRLASLVSWNAYLMLGISPNVLTRPAAIGDECVRHGCRGANVRGLGIVALQEAWAFKVGALYPFVAFVAMVERWALSRGTTRPTSVDDVLLPKTSHLVELVRANSVPSLVVQLLSVLLHIVSCGMCTSGIRSWDPKATIAATVASGGYPCAVGLSASRTASTNRRAWVDSGLLLLSSLAADDSGFEAFRELGGEGLANKGMLWALWRGSAACAGAAADSVLVINTHLSAERDARGKRVHASQLAQLSLLIERRAAACGASAEIYVCGDFNLRADDPALDAFATSNKLRRIQFNGTTDFERSGQIDHILASRHSNAFVPAEPTYCSLSDHAAVAIERRV